MKMGRYLLLWLLGVPIPILLLIWAFGGLLERPATAFDRPDGLGFQVRSGDTTWAINEEAVHLRPPHSFAFAGNRKVLIRIFGFALVLSFSDARHPSPDG
jgi:hypothetical protein